MRRMATFLVGSMLLVAGPAVAQDTSRVEASAGWRFYHVDLSSTVTSIELAIPNDYARGWYADVAANLSPKFALVGEAGGSYHTADTSRTSGTVTFAEDVRVTFHTFMGGIRVRAPQRASLVPFGQVLFGGERDSSRRVRTTTIGQQTPFPSEQEAGSSSAVLALDAGTTLAVGRIGVRAAVGYVRFFGEADADAFRLSLGGAFRF